MTIILGEAPEETSARVRPSPWSSVPWRTIIGAIVVVAAFLMGAVIVVSLRRIIVWFVVAGFFAIVLAPAVRRVQARVGGHRAVATAIVMFSAAAVVGGLLAVFVLPLRSQVVQVVTDLPGTIEAASNGTGPIGRLVTRLNLNDLVRDHQDDITGWADDLTRSSVGIAASVLQAVLAFVTIFVMAFLLLTQAGSMGRSLLLVCPPRRRAALQRVATDSAAAVSGYMVGNVLISAIAGVSAFVLLLVLGVPNPAVFALWVAVADLIPLVGATLGAAVAVFAAFLDSNGAGVAALVFFVLYQQFENSVLQPSVMSRTVKVNPLVVLLSVLIGVELFGFVGAILAIPLAGSLQVLAKEIWSEARRDKLVLPDEIPN